MSDDDTDRRGLTAAVSLYLVTSLTVDAALMVALRQGWLGLVHDKPRPSGWRWLDLRRPR